MLIRSALVVALIAVAASAGAALAQSNAGEQGCFNRSPDRPAQLDERIAACLRVIDDSSLSAEVRSEAHLRRALAYAQKAQHANDKADIDRAVADLSEGLRLDPDNGAAQRFVYQTRAGLHFHKGDYDQAIADYTSLLRLDPSATIYGFRGFVYATRGDHERAIADYTQAIQLEPKVARIHAQRAWSNLQAGRSEEALADADRVVMLEPDTAASYGTRVAVYRALGKTAEAVADLRKALSLEPGNDGIKEELRLTEFAATTDGAGASGEKERLKAELRKAQEAARTAQERLAALESADTKVAMAPGREASNETGSKSASADPDKLARALQTELKRVGCLSGEVDGDWGQQSRKALKDFARHAKLSIAGDDPTEAALDAAAAMNARACPLVCDDGEKLVDGRCVAKQRKVRREPAREARRNRAEPPAAESSRSGSSGGLKLCYAGGRGQMTVCP